MARLRGLGLGRGMALGTAAVVTMRSGFPLIPPIPARIAELLAKRRLDEMPDVILVAEDYQMALDIAGALRWGRVVGIASGNAPQDAPLSAYPAVVNVPTLMELVQDDMLMVVDADHGVVIADPDGMTVAQYQAEHHQLQPKRRLFLDSAHLPAETVDDRMVLVIARVETVEAVTHALEVGADALYIPFDAPLLSADADDRTERQNLLSLIEQSSGKSLLIADEYELPPMLLLEAGLRADITVAVPPMEHLDGLGVGELGMELNEAQADCLANDAQCEMPRLAISLAARSLLHLDDPERMAHFVDRLAMWGATRIVLTANESGVSDSLLPYLDNLIAAANAAMLPVIVPLGTPLFPTDDYDSETKSLEIGLRFAVGAGVAGVIVAPEDVTAVKSAIRELNYSECREALSQMLSRESV